jgi:hypothetical protein
MDRLIGSRLQEPSPLITGKWGLFWSRGLFVLAVGCMVGWVFGTSWWHHLIIVAGGLAAIGAGLLTYADVGGAGSDWARAQLRWQRRFPFYRSLADRTDPRDVYRLLGIGTIGLGAVLIVVGVLGYAAST